MIQAAMYFALGLMAAGLLALLVTPAIWRRAMRLARARIEAAVPMSRSEIEADKDQLRAGFAISNRRLEMETGRLKEKLAEETIAVNRRSDEIATLTRDKATLIEAISGLEERVSDLAGALTKADGSLAAAGAEIALRDGRLAEREAVLAAAQEDLNASQLMSEELRLEMVARQTEIGNLGDRLAALVAAESISTETRQKFAAELAAERERVAADKRRVDSLEASFAALQAERSGRLADLERRANEVRGLEAEIAGERAAREVLAAEADGIRAERARLVAELAARGDEIATLNAGLGEHARRHDDLGKKLDATETELVAARAELGNMNLRREADVIAEGDNFRKAIAATEAEKEAMTLRLAALEDDVAALRAENAELRGVAGAEWESDREENRRLRERLNEIAAGVVRLTQSLENGDAMPAADEGGHATAPLPLPSASRPASAATSATAEPGEGTLAERLRALQHAGARH